MTSELRAFFAKASLWELDAFESSGGTVPRAVLAAARRAAREKAQTPAGGIGPNEEVEAVDAVANVKTAWRKSLEPSAAVKLRRERRNKVRRLESKRVGAKRVGPGRPGVRTMKRAS